MSCNLGQRLPRDTSKHIYSDILHIREINKDQLDFQLFTLYNEWLAFYIASNFIVCRSGYPIKVLLKTKQCIIKHLIKNKSFECDDSLKNSIKYKLMNIIFDDLVIIMNDLLSNVLISPINLTQNVYAS